MWHRYIFPTSKTKQRTDGCSQNVQREENEILNINALVINRQKLVDEIRVTGITLPNEEVDLSFETSGKVIGIYFK